MGLEGRTPPDFPPNDSEIDFVGRGTRSDLTQLGRKMLGFEQLSGHKREASCESQGGGSCVATDGADGSVELLRKCDAILGFQGIEHTGQPLYTSPFSAGGWR